MNINDTFQKGFERIKELAITIHPEITEDDLLLIKRECKSMVMNIILNIGNSINSTTHEIE